MAEDAGKQ